MKILGLVVVSSPLDGDRQWRRVGHKFSTSFRSESCLRGEKFRFLPRDFGKLLLNLPCDTRVPLDANGEQNHPALHSPRLGTETLARRHAFRFCRSFVISAIAQTPFLLWNSRLFLKLLDCQIDSTRGRCTFDAEHCKKRWHYCGIIRFFVDNTNNVQWLVTGDDSFVEIQRNDHIRFVLLPISLTYFLISNRFSADVN